MNGWPVILMSLETREKLVSQFVQSGGSRKGGKLI